MKKFPTFTVVSISIIVILIWVNGELLLLDDQKKEHSRKSAPKVLSTVATTTVKKIIEKHEGSSQKNPVATVASVVSLPLQKAITTHSLVSDPESLIHVTLDIAGMSVSYQIEKGSTVEHLLQEASETGGLFYESKSYSGIGAFIESIDGVKNNANGNEHYWVYSINGNKATVGVSQYKPKEGDVISWNYELSIY